MPNNNGPIFNATRTYAPISPHPLYFAPHYRHHRFSPHLQQTKQSLRLQLLLSPPPLPDTRRMLKHSKHPTDTPSNDTSATSRLHPSPRSPGSTKQPSTHDPQLNQINPGYLPSTKRLYHSPPDQYLTPPQDIPADISHPHPPMQAPSPADPPCTPGYLHQTIQRHPLHVHDPSARALPEPPSLTPYRTSPRPNILPVSVAG